MALYKYTQYLGASQDTAFDTVCQPGTRPVYSGIYRCEGCGREISHNASNSLPPQNHHQHTAAQGAIRWKMTVNAMTNG